MTRVENIDKIQEIMVRKVVTVGPGDDLATAARRMTKKGIGSIAVVKGDRLIGIITESDFMRYASVGLDMGKARVGNHMRRRVVTCDPSCRIWDALMIMKRRKVRHLPVTTKTGRLLGIVSLRDLIAASQLTSIYLI